MTLVSPTTPTVAGSTRPRRPPSVTVHVVGVALAVSGVGLMVSGLVDLIAEAADTVLLLALGGVAVGGGLGLRRLAPVPTRVPPRVALRSVMVAATAMIVVSTIVYVATGTITRLDDALFESTAGFSTTALTVIDDLEAVDDGVLFWRALTQWMGAFFALATIVAVLPFLGVGGPRPVGARTPLGARHLFSPHVRNLLRRYLGLYVVLTVAGAALFLVGGMSPFDAVTYAFTTISTGGFANHDRSFAHFDSDLIEWLGVAGMLLGGLSLPLAWQAVRGKTRSTMRSTELWAYLGLLGGATVVVSLTTDSGSGWHDTVRQAAFSVASSVSTTGHWVTDWTQWSAGPQMLLLVLIGIGAMSASMGGGFRIVRAMALSSWARRELTRQLVPRSVGVVRVGRTVVDEQTAERMLGYQVLFVGTAAAGLLALALTGLDFVSALSGSISALATMGPALGELAPGRPLLELGHGELLVLMILMLSGRLELYVVLNAVVSVVTLPFRLVTGRLRRSTEP